jgi:hypothetical protein
MRSLVAQWSPGFGTLHAKIDQREQAHVGLPAAIECYRSIDITFWLPQAEAAMESFSSPSPEYAQPHLP